MKSKKTILVTGAAGFIGYHLFIALLEVGLKRIIIINQICQLKKVVKPSLFGEKNTIKLTNDYR